MIAGAWIIFFLQLFIFIYVSRAYRESSILLWLVLDTCRSRRGKLGELGELGETLALSVIGTHFRVFHCYFLVPSCTLPW